jgi:hypothetical protein
MPIFRTLSLFFCSFIFQSRKTKHTSSVSNYGSLRRYSDRQTEERTNENDEQYIKRIRWGGEEEKEKKKKRTRRAHIRGSSFTLV